MRRVGLLFAFVFLLAACGEGMDTDSGTPGMDAGTADAGGGGADGGGIDAGGGTDGGGIDAGDGTDAGGTDAGGGGTDSSVPPADAGCSDPRPSDGSAIGSTCSPDGVACPTGLTCLALNGIVLTYRCEILCGSACDCPVGYACRPTCDKAGCTDTCHASSSP